MAGDPLSATSPSQVLLLYKVLGQANDDVDEGQSRLEGSPRASQPPPVS